MSAKRLAAVLTPTGAHLIRYRRRRGRLEVVRYRGEVTPRAGVEEAAKALAELIEAEGGRGVCVALGLAGFGSCHHLLSLPPAAPELLEPIVHREMRRFYPGLFEEEGAPYIDFVAAADPGEGSEGTLRDLLVAGLPRSTVEAVRRALAPLGSVLEHVTVVPAAVANLFDAFVGRTETAALALVADGYSALGFFHEGGLRLFTEPPMRSGLAGADVVVAEQVDRGALYLRQQFRGARLRAVHLSASPAERPAILTTLQASDDVAVRQLAPGEEPAALLALGVALNAEDERALNLLPHGMRPPSRSERLTRMVGSIAAGVVIVAVSWWALMGVRAEAVAAERFRNHQDTLVPRAAAFARIEPVVRERQAHATRSELLHRLIEERERIPELLWPLQAAGTAVQMQSFNLARTADGWQGRLVGQVESWSSADAAAIVEALQRELARSLPPGAVTLGDLAYGTDSRGGQPSAGVAVRFRMSLVIPAGEWGDE